MSLRNMRLEATRIPRISTCVGRAEALPVVMEAAPGIVFLPDVGGGLPGTQETLTHPGDAAPPRSSATPGGGREGLAVLTRAQRDSWDRAPETLAHGTSHCGNACLCSGNPGNTPSVCPERRHFPVRFPNDGVEGSPERRPLTLL